MVCCIPKCKRPGHSNWLLGQIKYRYCKRHEIIPMKLIFSMKRGVKNKEMKQNEY